MGVIWNRENPWNPRRTARTSPVRRAGALAPALVLALAAGLALACGGGHSSPSEPAPPAPKGDSLAVVSVSPAEGTPFPAGSPFHVHVLLQYHLADGPQGSMRFAELRADGSPLHQSPIPIPIFDFPFPLIFMDHTLSFDAQDTVPLEDVGPEVLLRFRLYPKSGGDSTASVTLHYPISR
jgi:hypothetical protein